MNLNEFFSEYPRVAVAFSGGVDSAYLLYEAQKYAEKVQAYYVKSDFQPQFELDDALRLAKELDIKIEVINIDVLSDKNIVSNTCNRCYHCKKRIFEAIIKRAKEDGFSVILDGTNASDSIEERPGIRALHELCVLSPLKICGLTKKEIRRLSKEANLFTHNKPSYACLATRIYTGDTITKEKLTITEKAEDFLFFLGLTDFRVRMLNSFAQLQICEKDFSLFIKKKKEISGELKKYYKGVLLDLEARNNE